MQLLDDFRFQFFHSPMRDSTSLLLFTGLHGAGVSTRVAALRVAIGQDNGFRGHEVDRNGKPVGDHHAADRLGLLELMSQDNSHGSTSTPLEARGMSRYFLEIEAGGHKNQVEIWEPRLQEAIAQIDRVGKFDGIVVSVSLESDRGLCERDLNSILHPLRLKYWTDFRQRRLPWIIFDLTGYDALFGQIVVEMLDGLDYEQAISSFASPYSFALRRHVQELAVRSFCQHWIGDNELTLLASLERQRCSTDYRPRVMMQVSSAWGFLAGKRGPGARQPANCRREGLRRKLRFPDFNEIERRVLTARKRGSSTTEHETVEAALMETINRFYSIWKPIGIVEPIPTVTWGHPAPNMFWAPEMMSNLSAGRQQ